MQIIAISRLISKEFVIQLLFLHFFLKEKEKYKLKNE